MAIVRVMVVSLVLVGSLAMHAQQPKSLPCNGSTTVDSGDAATASSARAFVVELQNLIRDGDKQAIASRVDYPLRVNKTVNGKPSHATVRGSQQFVAGYDRLFSDKVKAAVLNPNSVQCLFVNDQGFMIGDGELWFQQVGKAFRISALNP